MAFVGTAGRVGWGMKRDKKGHRDYSLTMQVETTDVLDGPASILFSAPGLPAIGSVWTFGNDNDPWAHCFPEVDVNVHGSKEGHPGKFWRLKYLFSTRPLERCQDAKIDNPLLEPAVISGSFVDQMKPADQDKDGNLILNSSHEPVHGIEKRIKLPTVHLEQNVIDPQLGLLSETLRTKPLNDAPMWGLDARTIRVDACPWTRKFYGTCSQYFTRKWDFSIDENTWDIGDLADKGFRHLAGKWVADASAPKKKQWEYFAEPPNDADDPRSFVTIKGIDDQPVQDAVMLDGLGKINTDPKNSPAFVQINGEDIKLYDETNLLQFGIPDPLF